LKNRIKEYCTTVSLEMKGIPQKSAKTHGYENKKYLHKTKELCKELFVQYTVAQFLQYCIRSL
jgi:hypothetical protein